MEIILYTIGCPHCNILKDKLKQKGIDFKIVDDVDEMEKLDIISAPQLFNGEKLLNYNEALEWLSKI
ncbi:MAG: glutaredoxin [Methanobrevibacter sp.]|nr:glutaredoxin [Methanobrevibacter sp.]